MNQPIRLILINSGTFGRAEVDLSRVSHFVAKNNLGKTSLMTTLQFLYVSNHNKHQFPTSLRETRKHYFPTRKSYVLFECRTAGGLKTVLFRGKGELEDYDFERKLYGGPYREEFFLCDGENLEVHAPEDTDQFIAGEGLDYYVLDPRKHRAALRGTSNNQSINLGLVPTATEDDYIQFCDLYVGLLQLSDLRQERIEDLFIQVHERDLSTKTVSLYDHSDEWESILEKQRQLQVFQTQKTAIDNLLMQWREFRKNLRHVKELAPKLRGAYRDRLASIQSQQEEIKQEKKTLDERMEELKSKRRQLRKERDGVLENKAREEQKRDDLQDGFEQFENFDVNWTRQEVRNLKRSVQSLQTKLDRSLEKSETEYKHEIGELNAKLETIETKIEGCENSFYSLLKDEFDHEQLEVLFTLLNPTILGVSTEAKGVGLESSVGFYSTLGDLLERYDEPDWQFDFGRFSLESPVLEAPNIDVLENPRLLRVKREKMKQQLSQLRDLLERRRDQDEIEEEIHEKESALKSKQKKLHEYESFMEQQPAEKHSELEQNIESLTTRAQTLEQQIEEHDDSIESLNENLQQLDRKRKQLETRRDSTKKDYEQCMNSVEQLSEETSQRLPEAEEAETEKTFNELVESWEQSLEEFWSQEYSINKSLEFLRDNLPDYRIKGSDRKQAIQELKERNEAFEQRKQDLGREWQDALTSLSSVSENLLESLEVLARKVNQLNHRMNRQQVSNLEYVRLNFDRRTEDVESLKRTIQAGRQEQDLFDVDGQLKLTIERLQNLARAKEKLRIRDLFGLTFEVKKSDGPGRQYADLSQIQSRGTTITIKVLFGLILLNGLLESSGPTEVRIPFLIDEVLQLDGDNILSIRRLAERLHFVPFFNGTTEIDGTDVIYLMREYNDGKVYLEEHHRIELNRKNPVVDGSARESEAGTVDSES